jgi:hypothetical protein
MMGFFFQSIFYFAESASVRQGKTSLQSQSVDVRNTDELKKAKLTDRNPMHKIVLKKHKKTL